MVPEIFSIIDGGPTFHLLQRLGLRGAGWRRVVKCFVAALLVTWLPMLLLALLQGNSTPFLRDINVLIRFLLALPLLLLAEPLLAERSAHTLQQFWQENLLTEECRARFTAAVETAVRRCNRWLSELLLLLLALASSLGLFAGLPATSLSANWQFSTSLHPTLPGIWYAGVANTLFVFLIYRWLWRIAIWWLLLARLAPLPLLLVPTHPDRSAGLGFLAFGQEEFAVLILAISLTTAALGANNIIYRKLPLSTQVIPLILIILLALVIIFGPLCAYCRTLFRVKVQGLWQYGSLAARYTQAFHKKWLGDWASHAHEEDILGNSDVQALADLGTSYEYVRRIVLIPFAPRLLLAALLAAALPFLLLALVTTPVETTMQAIPKLVVKIISGG